MVTKNQLRRKIRVKKFKLNRTPILEQSPQRKGICAKILFMNPKKPNSAIRKVAKVRLLYQKKRIKFVFSYIPGEGGHNLQEYSVVLMRGGRVRDLPGMKYKLIRGKLDLNPVMGRVTSRSKYGKKRDKK